MATYVTSDIHGHLRALDRALELAQPGSQDSVFVLGDMVDRGPDPLGVIRLVRSLAGAQVLMGNHEAMLLETIAQGDAHDMMAWHLNGGFVTSEQLEALSREAYADVMDWLGDLPTFAVVDVHDQRATAAPDAWQAYVLCHAGIAAPRLCGSLAQAGVAPSAQGGYGGVAVDELVDAMMGQDVSDLLWIRGEFWSEPTGLIGRDGRGPVVVAGHTPSIILGRYARLMCGTGVDENLRGVMVEVGPSRDTGGTADRICIDCSAAAGYPSGRVGIMRLEDRRIWYADINEGE